MTTLLLDPDIRDWVVLPLFVMIVFAGLLRQIVAQYMQGAKQPIPIIALRANGVAKQCHALRTAAAHSISTVSWMAHRDAAVELLREEAEWLESDENSGDAEDPMEKMMANPMGMLGGNMVFMVQNMVSQKINIRFFLTNALCVRPFRC
jgi:ER membrane protein complex subunit 3